MLIDWITARLPYEMFTTEEWEMLTTLGDRVIRYCPRSGEVRWETSTWESIRSDSHQITIRVGSDAFWMQGSPARCIGSGDAVFGEGASHALDLVGCVSRMARFASSLIGFDLYQHHEAWKVSRIDVTGNLHMKSLDEVRESLTLLRSCEGGRYRVSQQAGDTVYWSHKSRLKSGKAYAKGPHIKYMMKNKNYTGYEYTEEQKQLSNNLLRLELKLGAQWLRDLDKNWYEITPGQLYEEWTEYFERMIGTAEMTNDNELREKLFIVSPTDGQAKSAYCTWCMIQSTGWEKARNNHTKPTWYRNIKHLKNAGLGDLDLSVGEIVQLRRRIIDAQLVESWAELKNVA